MDGYKVSVIVPVYKVEAFVDRCFRSLMEQTLQDVEFIVIDDCTPDRSIAVIRDVMKDYPWRDVQIVSHKENKGLPSARNTGLAMAKGEYVFHCDSDDWVEPDMLETLYDTAEKEDADIVWCDWFLSFGEKERYMRQPSYSTPLEALKGMLSGVMKYNVWNKLVRRDLYVDNGIAFPDGYGMGEDMTMMRLFSCARRVAYVGKAFYHYVKLNSNAFSQTYSERHLIELRYNTNSTLAYLAGKYGSALANEYEYFKLDVKFPFLITKNCDKYNLWLDWYPEANKYVLKNTEVSFRRRILQYAAWKNQFWIVRLYYFVFNVIYGCFYRR